MPDNIDPAKKAAIIAAVAAFMGSKPRPAMFLRDCKDSGPWGKLSRMHANVGSGYRQGRARKG